MFGGFNTALLLTCSITASDVCSCRINLQALMMQMASTHLDCCHWHIRDWRRAEAWLLLHR